MNDKLYDNCSVGDLVVSALARGGDRVAFICDDTRWTYRQLGAMVSQVIQALQARGLQRGDAVATLSGNRPEAFLITAASYVMGLRLTWMNPTSSEDDHAYILEDSGVRTLFVDPVGFSDRARVLARRVPAVTGLMSFGPNDGFGEDLLAAAAVHTPARLVPQAEADDVCVLIYTGGTTGKPKGVMHTHRVQVTMILTEMADWDWPADIRFLALTPITHASGAMIMPVLLKSGTYAMTQGFTAEKFVHLVETHRITATFLVPTMVYVLLDSPARQGADLSSLKLIIYGASPMSPTRLVEGMQVFGPVFMQLYAQSEAPNTVTVLHQHEHDPVNHPERLASCGTPCVGTQVRLLDDDGQEVADGAVGETCVRGPLVMKGYWNKPEETAQALRHGWLYTGDMARRDADGYLYIVDRSKDMIISGGFNVYPREVEDTLSQHPAVAAAAVVGVPDAKWGEAVRALVVLRAVMVGDAPADPVALAAELMAWVRERKGAVQTPKAIDFVDALPMTGLGKLDKKAIRARFWQGQQRAVH
ncbi:MAG: AMP-binding protein [Microbacteriaceae bacterium]|nr:AMP-binding protein [Burkholderiaceae bacterium]